MKNVQLLGIDVQNDFCDQKSGSLVVAGADQDAIRLSKFVDKFGKKLNDVHITLDSHRSVQIFHPIFWIDSKGNHPNPFTIISQTDVENGTWRTTNPSWTQRGIDYVRALKAKGKFDLCIWPYHCIISSLGSALVPIFSNSLIKWEKDNFAMVDYCVKGDFYMSEHYGILEAEVTYPEEPSTMLNTKLVEAMIEADDLVIGGQALSHCVKTSLEQIAANFGDDNIKKFVLLRDTTSSVTGFEAVGDKFVKDMEARGMRVTTTVDYLA